MIILVTDLFKIYWYVLLTLLTLYVTYPFLIYVFTFGAVYLLDYFKMLTLHFYITCWLFLLIIPESKWVAHLSYLPNIYLWIIHWLNGHILHYLQKVNVQYPLIKYLQQSLVISRAAQLQTQWPSKHAVLLSGEWGSIRALCSSMHVCLYVCGKKRIREKRK